MPSRPRKSSTPSSPPEETGKVEAGPAQQIPSLDQLMVNFAVQRIADLTAKLTNKELQVLDLQHQVATLLAGQPVAEDPVS